MSTPILLTADNGGWKGCASGIDARFITAGLDAVGLPLVTGQFWHGAIIHQPIHDAAGVFDRVP